MNLFLTYLFNYCVVNISSYFIFDRKHFQKFVHASNPLRTWRLRTFGSPTPAARKPPVRYRSGPKATAKRRSPPPPHPPQVTRTPVTPVQIPVKDQLGHIIFLLLSVVFHAVCTLNIENHTEK